MSIGYVALYLLIGILSFGPMLCIDKECEAYVTQTYTSIVLAWALWAIVWLPSLLVDGVFWMMDRD